MVVETPCNGQGTGGREPKDPWPPQEMGTGFFLGDENRLHYNFPSAEVSLPPARSPDGRAHWRAPPIPTGGRLRRPFEGRDDPAPRGPCASSDPFPMRRRGAMPEVPRRRLGDRPG